MRVLVSGLYGHMGREVAALLRKGAEGGELTAGVSLDIDGSFDVPCSESFAEACPDVDCIIDFSHHSCTRDLLEFAVSRALPVVLATTGQTEVELQMIRDASEKIPLFFAANYSLGVALLIDLAKKAAQVMSGAEIEIIERHHNRKVDAPSGTALAIANAIREVRPGSNIVNGRSGYGKRDPQDIGIHAIRMGNIVGIHEVVIGTDNQSITLKHEAYSRALFAEGALKAAAFLQDKPAGLYDMNSLLKEN
ncbi:MAG: 4-hydroxy-tetrahydrodipicolinate reductase [Parasporobacterium sp.]|nr:4-hydroxy-tetrahydrodipicolinate reductase [Parasporobacterium sp.]